MSVGSAVGVMNDALGAPTQKVYYVRVGHPFYWAYPSNAGANFSDDIAVLQTWDANGSLNTLDPTTRTVGPARTSGSQPTIVYYGTFTVSGVNGTPGNNFFEIRNGDKELDWKGMWETATQTDYAALNHLRSSGAATTPANTPPLYLQWAILDTNGNSGAIVREIRIMFLGNLSYSGPGMTVELLDANKQVVWRHIAGKRNAVTGPIVQWTGAYGNPNSNRINRVRLVPI